MGLIWMKAKDLSTALLWQIVNHYQYPKIYKAVIKYSTVILNGITAPENIADNSPAIMPITKANIKKFIFNLLFLK